MARAFKQVWVSMALAALVACALGELDHTLLHAQAPLPAQPLPAQGRPSRARIQLATGIDWLRRGDLELASSFFQQAKAGEDDLTPAEKEELLNRIQYVEMAVKARKDGNEQLRRAEEAVKANRTQEALSLLKEISNNPNLTPTDRLRTQTLMEQIQPRSPVAQQPVNSTTGLNPLLRARSMLQNARGLMLKGEFDAAEGLAKEAKSLNVAFTPNEDTPQKVLDDLSRARIAKRDAKSLLTAARAALERGDVDGAEKLAKESEKSQSFWSVHLWGDSPSKVLKEVKDARAKAAVAAAKTPAELPKAGSGKSPVALPPPPTRDTDGARQALREGRQALASGNLDKAEYCARVAKEKNPDLNWWDDTPDKLLTDIRRAGRPLAGNDKAKADSTAKSADSDNNDPRAMLREARDQFTHGKLDEAKDLALKANSAGARWGLFEDSPDKLLGEIQTARTKRDKEESFKVLAEARKLFEQGNYEDAERKAYQAERMHGSYSIWDMGDRPHKLVAEIESARSKAKKNKIPPPPNEVARTDQNKDRGAAAKTGSTDPVQNNPAPPAENRVPPVVQQPQTAPQQAQQTPPSTAAATDAVAQQPPPASTGSETEYSSPLSGGGPRATAPGQDFTRQRARQLLAECRELQKKGQLVEAHEKAGEALKVGAAFDPSEDRPERAMQELAALAEKQIENLKQAATDCASEGSSDPARYLQSERQLTQARQIAIAFGLDLQPIEVKLAWVRQLQSGGTVTVANAPQPPGYLTPTGMQEGDREKGLKLLEQSRMEIRRGETGTARRIAEEAFSGRYCVQAEAAALLRSIDNEEFVQRQKELRRKVDTVVEAFKRKDVAGAKAVLDQIDMTQLPPEQRSRLKNVMDSPEMARQVAAVTTPVGVAIPGPGGVIPTTGRSQASDVVPVAGAAAGSSENFAQQIQQMQEIKLQQFRKKSIEAQQDAMSRLQAGQPDEAIEILEGFRGQLDSSGLEPEKVTLLRRPVEKRIQDFKALKAQGEWEALRRDKGEKVFAAQSKQALQQENTRKQVGELMDQYKTFLREAKYDDAVVFAMKAHELDPDNPATGAAMYTARVLRAQARSNEKKKNENEHATGDLIDAEEMGPRVNTDHPVDFDKDRTKISKSRVPLQNIGSARKSEKERDIERRLTQPVTVGFDKKPLKEVIDDLRELTGVNIVTDLPALAEVGTKEDVPISLKLEGVCMKSALNVLLHQVDLTYVVKDEVLQVTTPKRAKGKLIQKTYPVADLVIPVDNFMISPASNLMNVINQNNQPNIQTGGASPITGRNMMANGQSVGSASGSMSENQPTSDGHLPAATSTRAGTRAPGQADNIHEVLIKLITNTISPQTWSDVGGPGTIDYFPLGMALIINQTPDVQEQVQDLLDALRRLQDLEVAVEVRMISLEEAFFERIGMDFNVNLTQGALGHNNSFQNQVVTQQFQPLNLINFPNPHDVIAGLQPAGSGGGSPNGSLGALTSDLGIPIRNSSFTYAIPPFGGYPNIPGFDGGLSMGLAFLSDIQVFMFMEAAQGDRRTNVMQAPKLTLFNGQTATIQIQDFQWFVTNVQVVQNAGQVVFVPQNQPIPMGINLAIQAVVSADRRFVRLNIAPTMTNLASATVPLFPITTFITPVFEGGAQGQPVPFTQFIQQPTFTTVTIQTTVSVPDGGTVLLGGLKLMNEGRNEFGPPVLSKIPYLDRLFRNVGYGKDTSSLLLMVTPRIIINTEEEFLQTGVDSSGLNTINRQ